MTETEDIIKVYDGSVEIFPKNFKFSATEEMQKLMQDYKEGKITLEEYNKKTMELVSSVKDESEKVLKKFIVEVGYQITVGDGTISEIVPISSDDDKWWDK